VPGQAVRRSSAAGGATWRVIQRIARPPPPPGHSWLRGRAGWRGITSRNRCSRARTLGRRDRTSPAARLSRGLSSAWARGGWKKPLLGRGMTQVIRERQLPSERVSHESESARANSRAGQNVPASSKSGPNLQEAAPTALGGRRSASRTMQALKGACRFRLREDLAWDPSAASSTSARIAPGSTTTQRCRASPMAATKQRLVNPPASPSGLVRQYLSLPSPFSNLVGGGCLLN